MGKSTLRPSPTAILNPRLDVNFKAIFTQETKESDTALISFLSSVLGRKIKNVKITNNEPPADYPTLLQMSFDVAVIFDDGERASIEMQGRDREYDYSIRSEVQVARLLNLTAKKGSDWEADKVYQISVLNFHLPKDDKCEMSWYTMKNQKGHELASYLNVIHIDLLEIKKLLGKPVEELTPLQKWGLYFSYADNEKYVDYIKQIAESEVGIMEADRLVGRMSEEESNWFRELSIDTARRDYNASMKIAHKKGLKAGLEKGIKQGLEKGKIETAKKAISMGLSIEQIVQLTQLDRTEIEKLLKTV